MGNAYIGHRNFTKAESPTAFQLNVQRALSLPLRACLGPRSENYTKLYSSSLLLKVVKAKYIFKYIDFAAGFYRAT